MLFSKKQNNHFIKGTKILDEEEFYRYYFGSDSQKTDTSLIKYYLPGSKIQKKMTLFLIMILKILF